MGPLPEKRLTKNSSETGYICFFKSLFTKKRVMEGLDRFGQVFGFGWKIECRPGRAEGDHLHVMLTIASRLPCGPVLDCKSGKRSKFGCIDI
jgi:hypothetical protein